MHEYELTSKLGAHIEAFILQKQASGYPYETATRILRRFDRMIQEKFPEATALTKDICDQWLREKPGEHPNGLLRRVTPVRQLAKYMNGMGLSAYVIPGHIPNKQIRYEPHIYSESELKAFFKSVDGCPDSVFSPLRRYVIPVIFRLLYCCGLRSSEARLLSAEDVDLNSGKVTIRESKGWRSRVVYMSADMLDVCREYDAIIRRRLPERDAFFPNKNGRFYGKSTLDCWFHEFWDRLPEADLIVGNSPRVHDFRHVYAVNRMNGWVRDGQNTNALYPYLSEYMGHSHYVDTDYYLALIESFYPEMERRMSGLNDEILPEVCHEE
jgi:integrase